MEYHNNKGLSMYFVLGVMALDNFFDDYGLVLLLVLVVIALTNNRSLFGEQDKEGEAEAVPIPQEEMEESYYLFRSSNRKRMKPKSVYF